VAEQQEQCPVRAGDIWRSGRHWFACGDLHDGVLEAMLGEAPTPTLLYADPPWHESDTSRYWTLARKDGARQGSGPGWEQTIRRVLTPASDLSLLAYVEMSHLTVDEARAIARRMRARCDHEWQVQWTNAGKPVMQRLFTADFRLDWLDGGPVAQIVDGVDGRVCPDAALSGHEVGVVLDPCCGNGYTVRAAHRLGWTALAHELTPRRLWTAMLRTGSEHELVHRAV